MVIYWANRSRFNAGVYHGLGKSAVWQSQGQTATAGAFVPRLLLLGVG